jgi:ribulose-phosphate 3-epimerase
MVEILPSILSADFARLGDDIARMEKAGVSMLHVDVMDGHFVPNLTLGPPVVKSIRKVTRLTLDVHLMIEDPDRYAPIFIEAGADQVSVHQETCPHLDRTLRMIQSEGALAGVVINPSTPVSTLDEVLELADYVLVMSVNPGFGGQRFLPNSLRKVQALAERRRRNNGNFRIEMDGGLGPDNIVDAVRAGCDWIVAGSSIFGSADPETTVNLMQHPLWGTDGAFYPYSAANQRYAGHFRG